MCVISAQAVQAQKYPALEKAMMRLNFEEADKLLTQVPDSLERRFFEHHMACLTALVQQTPTAHKQFEALTERVEASYENSSHHAMQGYFLAELHLDRLLVQALHGENWTAAQSFRKL